MIRRKHSPMSDDALRDSFYPHGLTLDAQHASLDFGGVQQVVDKTGELGCGVGDDLEKLTLGPRFPWAVVK